MANTWLLLMTIQKQKSKTRDQVLQLRVKLKPKLY